jgi:hypothetical protein
VHTAIDQFTAGLVRRLTGSAETEGGHAGCFCIDVVRAILLGRGAHRREAFVLLGLLGRMARRAAPPKAPPTPAHAASASSDCIAKHRSLPYCFGNIAKIRRR